MTKREAIRMVRKADKSYNGRNVTRWYSTVHPRRNGEAKVLTWAVKTWKGKPLVMLASEYNTDGSTNHISGRCMINNFMNTRCFNWLDYGGKPHVAVWSDVDYGRDEWCEQYAHEFGKGHEFFGRFLNGLEGTRYRYARWEDTTMRISDFIDCYNVSPMTELIVKAGLHKWLTPSHIARLVANKPLARFLANHVEDLRNASPIAIVRAYAKTGEKTDIEELGAITELAPYGMVHVSSISPKRIWAWCKSHGVSVEKLRHHVDNLNELKMSLDYEPHLLPHDWETYSLEIEERAHEYRELLLEKESQMAKEARSFAKKTIAKWMEEGKIRKGYKVIIPASETELVEEGDAMCNCVRTYWGRIRSGSCSLVFIRKENKPYIDMEIENGKIVQMMYNHNMTVAPDSADGKMCNMISKAFNRKAA